MVVLTNCGSVSVGSVMFILISVFPNYMNEVSEKLVLLNLNNTCNHIIIMDISIWILNN